MRAGLFLLACALAAQSPDPAYEPLAKAYEALRNRQYEASIAFFQKGLEAAPGRAATHKDLAYTYLKIGENVAAREQFREAMRLEPAEFHVALEYAFLCYETRQKAQARRVFDRVRRSGDPTSRATAEQAFENVDAPLREGIARWQEAIRLGADNFSSHFELATLAEERDELELAAGQYESAWRLLPDRRSVLVDLGRVLKALNRIDSANAALLAASRGGEPRAAEAARELLPARYPYVPEFRAALALDPANTELRRELAYLLLKMERQAEAEEQFKIIVRADQADLLSAAQLGFLYLARGDRLSAMPLLERVLRGDDEELANRVRAVLRVPQVLHHRASGPQAASFDAKQMAERSMKAGYLKDALKYLQLAQEADPVDFNVMLQLGWTYNLLHDDRMAARWFTLARRSPDPALAGEAAHAYASLRPGLARVRTSLWMLPFYSSRWHDVFSYGQARVEFGPRRAIRPYFTARFIGDTRQTIGTARPQFLSESSVILGLGLSTQIWSGLTAWGEAGPSFQYLTRHVTPDYRAGVSFFRGFGHALGSREPGWFAETSADSLYASRLGKDLIVYSQARYGYTPELGPLQLQVYANANLTFDARRQEWANFAELGPGLRFRWEPLPRSLVFSVNLLRGIYLRSEQPETPRARFFDFRAGFGYAFSY